MCPTCSLPKDLCVCEKISQEKQRIQVSLKFGKWKRIVTTIVFLGDIDVDLEKLCTKVKKFCAGGGTVKGNVIEVQGNHARKMKNFLSKEGFDPANIEINENLPRPGNR
ncbi:MAG TPA: stress response translation initiation inhibitor YciH [Candidatus Lokiarchaeia archaeon]|nr:stress response translation initiation inhibitor YciH [Candidatus Lokiarchaeia archaeon]